MISTYCELSAVACGSVVLGPLVGLRGVVPLAMLVVVTVGAWALS